MYDEILDALVAVMQPFVTLKIRRAALPTGAGIALEKGTSDVIMTALNRSTIEEMSCVLNAKHADLQTARQALSTLHRKLTRMASYPYTDDWQVTAVETISGPTTIGREAGGLWTVGSSIRVKFYDKESAV